MQTLKMQNNLTNNLQVKQNTLNNFLKPITIQRIQKLLKY